MPATAGKGDAVYFDSPLDPCRHARLPVPWQPHGSLGQSSADMKVGSYVRTRILEPAVGAGTRVFERHDRVWLGRLHLPA